MDSTRVKLPLRHPGFFMTGQARDLTAASVRLDRLDIAATASPLSAQPAGRLRLSASRDRENAGLECGFALVDQRLTLSALRLTAPETALTGQLGLDLAQGTVSGNLDGTSANLSGLGRFLGLPLAGSLKLAATADASSRSGQQLAATITASGLAVAGCTARELSLAASLDHLRDLPRGKAHLTAKDVIGGGLDLASLRLDAVGDGRNLETTADIRGALPSGQPLRLAATTRLTTTGQSRTLTVAALSGNLANHGGGNHGQIRGPGILQQASALRGAQGHHQRPGKKRRHHHRHEPEKWALRGQKHPGIGSGSLLIGLETPREGKKIRGFVHGLGPDGRRLGIALTAQDFGLTLGLGQKDCPIPIRAGFDFFRFFQALGSVQLGLPFPFGPHPAINGLGIFLGQIRALDADVHHLDAIRGKQVGGFFGDLAHETTARGVAGGAADGQGALPFGNSINFKRSPLQNWSTICRRGKEAPAAGTDARLAGRPCPQPPARKKDRVGKHCRCGGGRRKRTFGRCRMEEKG